MSAFRLGSVAPRLARARDDYVVWRRELAAARIAHMHRISHLEWLVAHRELQVARACAVGNGAYLGRRIAKLESARRELAAAEARRPMVA